MGGTWVYSSFFILQTSRILLKVDETQGKTWEVPGYIERLFFILHSSNQYVYTIES